MTKLTDQNREEIQDGMRSFWEQGYVSDMEYMYFLSQQTVNTAAETARVLRSIKNKQRKEEE